MVHTLLHIKRTIISKIGRAASRPLTYAITILVGLPVVLLGVLTPAVANAAQQQICGNFGTGYCLNDWNGNSNQVKMYYGGYGNEDFYTFGLNSMCNHGLATSTCPINISGLNLTGQPIVAIGYGNGSKCLGTNTTNGSAILGGCPDSSGNGGIDGTIMVWIKSSSTQGLLVNRHWTNADGYEVYLSSGGNIGVPAFFSPEGTPWGGLGTTIGVM